MAWDPTQLGQPGSKPGQDTYSGYGAQEPYGAPPPQPMAPVRSVGQSIQELPQQYINVVMHPSDATFAVELPKADWPMVWVQLGFLVIASVMLGLIATAIASTVVRSATSSSSAAAAVVLIPYAFVFVCGLLVSLAGPGFIWCGRGALRC